MKIKHGFVAYTIEPKDSIPEPADEVINVVHFCGQEGPCTEEQLHHLEEELNTDPEFGLVGRINKDVFVMMAPPEMVEFYIEQVGDTHEFDDKV